MSISTPLGSSQINAANLATDLSNWDSIGEIFWESELHLSAFWLLEGHEQDTLHQIAGQSYETSVQAVPCPNPQPKPKPDVLTEVQVRSPGEQEVPTA